MNSLSHHLTNPNLYLHTFWFFLLRSSFALIIINPLRLLCLHTHMYFHTSARQTSPETPMGVLSL